MDDSASPILYRTCSTHKNLSASQYVLYSTMRNHARGVHQKGGELRPAYSLEVNFQADSLSAIKRTLKHFQIAIFSFFQFLAGVSGFANRSISERALVDLAADLEERCEVMTPPSAG